MLIAVFFAWQFQPKYHANSNALSVLVTVFSILAGFLVAVMAIVGNERALRGRNWRQDTYYLVQIRRDLKRHAVLFYLYLLVLALAFLASLDLGWPKSVQVGVECFLLFLACLAMLMSFSLPGQLTRRHITDLEALIKTRRDEEARGDKPSRPVD
ncbi:hypothetical protein D3C78_1507100 [compost metagenome]